MMKNTIFLSYFLLSLVAFSPIASFTDPNSVLSNDNTSRIGSLEVNNIIKVDVTSNINKKININNSPINSIVDPKRMIRRKEKFIKSKRGRFSSISKLFRGFHNLTPEKLKDILEGRFNINRPDIDPKIVDKVIPALFKLIHLFSIKLIDPYLSSIYYYNHMYIDSLFSLYIKTSASKIEKLHKSKAYLNNFEKNLIYYQYFNVIVDHYNQLLDGKLGKLINKTFAKAKKSHPKQYKTYIDSVDIIQEKFHPFSYVVFDKLFHFDYSFDRDFEDNDTSKQGEDFNDILI